MGVHMYICIFEYMCMFVCLCMYVRTYVCMYAYMHICTKVGMRGGMMLYINDILISLCFSIFRSLEVGHGGGKSFQPVLKADGKYFSVFFNLLSLSVCVSSFINSFSLSPSFRLSVFPSLSLSIALSLYHYFSLS